MTKQLADPCITWAMNLVLGLKSKHCFYAAGILEKNLPSETQLTAFLSRMPWKSQHTHFKDKIQDQVSFGGFPATCWTHPYGLYCECAYSSTTTLTLSLSFQTWKSPLQKQRAQLPCEHSSLCCFPPSVLTLGLYLPELYRSTEVCVLWGMGIILEVFLEVLY